MIELLIELLIGLVAAALAAAFALIEVGFLLTEVILGVVGVTVAKLAEEPEKGRRRLTPQQAGLAIVPWVVLACLCCGARASTGGGPAFMLRGSHKPRRC